MSQSVIYTKNVITPRINGISGNVITNSNEVGQVLTITSVNPKVVEFKDAQAPLPDTTTEPAGYVLAIKTPATGELEWRQDAGGSLPDPLILSGDSINKFQVRDATSAPRFTIDTQNDAVKVQEAKFQVDLTGLPIFSVSGTDQGVSMRNAGGSEYAKFNYIDENLIIDGAKVSTKFNVRAGATQLFNIDSDANQIQNLADTTRVEGDDNPKKFGVYSTANDSINGVLEVSTENTNQAVTIQGQQASHKLRVKQQDGDDLFNVDSIGKNVQIVGDNSEEKLKIESELSGRKLFVNTLPTSQPVSIAPLNVPLYTMLEAGTPTNDFIGYLCKNGAGEFYLMASNQGSGTTGFFFNAGSSQMVNFSGSVSVGGQTETSIIRNVQGDPYAEIRLKDSTGIIINDYQDGAIILSTKKSTDLSSDRRAELILRSDLNPAILGVYEFNSYISPGGSNQENKIVLTNYGTEVIWSSLKTIRHQSSQNIIIGDGVITPTASFNPANNATISSRVIDITASNILNVTAVNDLNITATIGPLDIKTDTQKLTLNSVTNDLDVLAQNGLIRILGDGLLISGETGVTISGNIVIPTTSTLDIVDPPLVGTSVPNKAYVDDRVGGLSSGTLPSNQALGNVLTPQSLNPTAFLPSSPVTPANYIKAGQSYQLVMSGDAQFSNGNNFTITLVASNNGSPVTLGSVNIIVPNVSGSQTWELEADFTIRSVVSNLATIVCSFDFTYNDGQTFIGKRSLTSTNSLNITFSQTLTANVTFTSGGALNNITTQLYILKKVVDV